MTAQIAFTFDAKYCSGCKACQAACKDKNNLPVGVLWRRVVEVSGGTWKNVAVGSPSPIWENTVFAYNLSIACNHCVHPKCAGVCPVDAYHVRNNGVVILDTTKCVGCGYCAWACPYGAPQYNPEAGHMTKCDFCFDQLELGLPPACVAACPLRVLDYEETGERRVVNSERGTAELWTIPGMEHPFPLPTYSRTEPHLAIQPHPSMSNSLEKTVANLDEIQPRAASTWEEAPLVAFTLFGQMAVGGFCSMLWMFPWLWTRVGLDPSLLLPPYALIGLLLALGMAVSFAHLGTKRNVWRVFNHLSKSWLSREILMTVLFGAGWLASAATNLSGQGALNGIHGLTALLGLGLVYSMAQVYRLPSVPAWDTPRTNLRFFLSAILLGHLGMTSVLVYAAGRASLTIPSALWMAISGLSLALLGAQLFLMIERPRWKFVREGLLFSAIIALATTFLIPEQFRMAISNVIFLLTLIEQVIERWLFYELRE